MKCSLNGVWLKLERAKEHADSLQSHVWETFSVDANRPRMGVKFDSDSGKHILYINHMPELGDFLARCSTVTGDVVHNLVSALDHLAFQLALLHTGGNIIKPNCIQFPITDTADRFKEAKKRYLQEVSPAHATIIERFQGYHGVDPRSSGSSWDFHALVMLRDLASTDKHRLPIELTIPTSGLHNPHHGADFIFSEGISQQIASVGHVQFGPAILGAEVIRAKLPPGAVKLNVNMAGYTLPSIGISDRSVTGVIDKMAATVIKVVREFEPFF